MTTAKQARIGAQSLRWIGSSENSYELGSGPHLKLIGVDFPIVADLEYDVAGLVQSHAPHDIRVLLVAGEILVVGLEVLPLSTQIGIGSARLGTRTVAAETACQGKETDNDKNRPTRVDHPCQ